jgi:hypothetical protein
VAGFLSRLFGGGGSAPAAEPVTYKDFAIHAEPIREGDQYRISARIEKDGREHKLIRADTISDREQAIDASIGKAKQMIDEQGDGIFR